MKKIVSVLLIFVLVMTASADVSSARVMTDSLPDSDWEEYKSAHFIIYRHPSIELEYIKEFSRKCEKYYDVITERLGFERVDFWLWENRAKVFVYNDREKYLLGTGREGWSGASVSYKEKYMSTFFFEGDFFDVILPHELTHVILREAIGMKSEVPLWFEEGVAGANEKDSLARYLMVTKRMIGRGEYIPLGQLELITESKVMVPRVFYPTAATVIIFLLENKFWGKSKFVEFCNGLRDMRKYRGENFYTVFKKVYGIDGTDELDKEVVDFLDDITYEDVAGKKDFNISW